MSILEKIIASVSPEAGLRRAVAKAKLNLLSGSVRSYDAAKTGSRTDGWTSVSGSSANSEIAPQLPRIRERSRDLVRNNPYAAKAVNVLVNNIVGAGIVPEAKSGTDRQQSATEDAWNDWAEVADADGMLDFYGIQALVMRTVVESGECLVRFRARRLSDGLAVPFQLQVLEPEFIDTGRQGTSSSGYTIDGIEFDNLGRRTAYWLFNRHPGDNRAMMVTGITSSRVPAEDVLHIFDKIRPGQDRGVPWFAPTILRMWDLATYDEAELMRKRVEACIAAFVEQEAGGDIRPLGKIANGTNTDGTSGTTRRESFEPGMIEYMRPGESVEFNNPQGTGGYAEYMGVQLHAIAAGIGVTYEQMTGDMRQLLKLPGWPPRNPLQHGTAPLADDDQPVLRAGVAPVHDGRLCCRRPAPAERARRVGCAAVAVHRPGKGRQRGPARDARRRHHLARLPDQQGQGLQRLAGGNHRHQQGAGRRRNRPRQRPAQPGSQRQRNRNNWRHA